MNALVRSFVHSSLDDSSFVVEDPPLPSPRMRRVEELFSAALDVPTAQRASLLDRECAGDDELRRELDEFLAAGDRSTITFLSTHKTRGLPIRELQQTRAFAPDQGRRASE